MNIKEFDMGKYILLIGKDAEKKSEEIVTMAEDEANKIIKKLKGIKVIK